MSTALAAQQNNHTATGYKSVAYFANWATYGRNFNPQDLRADALTHVLFAFANVRPTGEVFLSDTWSDTNRRYSTDSWNDVGNNVYGCAKQLYLQKVRNRKLKTLLSIGGWTYSANFVTPASTPEGRSMFASSAIRLLQDLGFDGLDVDWEYPQNESQANDLVLLLAEIRQQLDEYATRHAPGRRLLLTIASPAGPSNYKILKLSAMDKHLDFWNMMAYDYSTSQDSVSGHHANWNHSFSNPGATPFDSKQAISDYIKAGIAPGKIVVGMPLYGRSFANTEGPGKPFSGVGKGRWEPGLHDYKDLPQPGAVIQKDDATAAAWSYDSVQRIMVSFDTPESVAQKTSYIKAEGLGGAMWWEASGDKQDANSLISTFVNGVGGVGALEQAQNLLSYPTSKYENIKAGMPPT
ncbi:endochitinase 1 precursor [Phaeosphaeriaceae sp. PMI808]|nr:endochitinase 1 precursor [Phaeosphaeriaceae sp. PMI808]KAH8706991.1 endochitinase 1 precursor [Phaeosphaeriaceae sp. PMI808]